MSIIYILIIIYYIIDYMINIIKNYDILIKQNYVFNFLYIKTCGIKVSMIILKII